MIDSLDLHGVIVTIDSMGCQKSIARKIIEAKGDYIFAVKDNHPKLSAAIEQYFVSAHKEGLRESGIRSQTVHGKSRGRIEKRFYAVGKIPESLRELTGPSRACTGCWTLCSTRMQVEFAPDMPSKT